FDVQILDDDVFVRAVVAGHPARRIVTLAAVRIIAQRHKDPSRVEAARIGGWLHGAVMAVAIDASVRGDVDRVGGANRTRDIDFPASSSTAHSGTGAQSA